MTAPLRHITEPAIVPAAGEPPKQIAEIFGRVASGDTALSLAHMRSPQGWVEPGQTPSFDEYTYVLEGELHVDDGTTTWVVQQGQGIATPAGRWVRFSTPTGPASYVAVCLPAFAPHLANRDDEPKGALSGP